jgi:hypothetical protein
LGGPIWTHGPIRVERLEIQSESGPIRGLLATIDLSDPRVEVVVTAATPSLPPGAEATLTPVDKWMAASGCVLAINGGFFGRLPENDTLLARARGWTEGEPVDLLGLSVSEGTWCRRR